MEEGAVPVICVYDANNTDFHLNGNAVLTPTECRIKQVAGGQYDLTMRHPIDGTGKWTPLVPEAIIKAPIPEETIESAISGMEADVYVVSSTSANIYSGPNAPTAIRYQEWYYQYIYQVGDKVTCSNWSHKNYKCIKFEEESPWVQVPPYNYTSWWTPIADSTSGDPVIGTLHQGDEVYLIENTGGGWMQITTAYGLTGYMQSASLTYSHHMTPAETQPRVIRDQLFRIKSVTRGPKQNIVNVTAEHVSYDLKGILVTGVDLDR